MVKREFFVSDKSGIREIKLEEIGIEETEGKKFPGRGHRINLAHCVYIGVRHCENFTRKVRWYCISYKENDVLRRIRKEQQKTISVEFNGVWSEMNGNEI